VAVTFAGISLGVRGYLAGDIQCFGLVWVAVVYRDLCGSNPIVLRRLLHYIKRKKQKHFSRLSAIGHGQWGSALAPQGH